MEKTKFTFRLPAKSSPETPLICPHCRALGCPDGPHEFVRTISANADLLSVRCRGCEAVIAVTYEEDAWSFLDALFAPPTKRLGAN